MSRSSQSHPILTAIAASLAAVTATMTAVPSHAGPSVLRAGFEDTVLPRNDDGSTCAGSAPDVTGRQVLGFTANFFGHEYARVCVNNNGNITFQQGLSTYTPFGLASTTVPIIAPFFADVDTRGTNNGAQPTTFGQGMVGDLPAFGATWRNVGYYSSHTEHLNTFQVVLISREDIAQGDFDIEFNYDSITWEAGTASGANSNGLCRTEAGDADAPGCTSATAGYSKGTGVAGTYHEIPGSRVHGAFLGRTGRTVFAVRNGAVQALDSDRDGISDEWEENGADLTGDGVIDVNLPAMGANKNHKDVFVEVDWMAARPPVCVWVFCWGARSFTPIVDALNDVRAAFANADVGNPDGINGITIHIDAGASTIMTGTTTWGGLSRANEVPYDANLGAFNPNGTYSWTEFQTLKDANFDEFRLPMFHYVVYADRYGTSGSSGISRGIGGSDYIVSDGPWPNGFTQAQERGTFMHELGHNLGLRHGGDDHENYEPNFVSIMNYSFQLNGIPPASTLDYSRSKLNSLNEFSLSEVAGLDPDGALGGRGTIFYCRPGGAIRIDAVPATNVDWNCNGAIDAGNIVTDINKDNAGSTLTGYDDWANIVYDGGDVGGEPGGAGEGPANTKDIEMTAKEAIASHVDAAPGDGAIDLEGPTSFVPGTGIQPVLVDVQNLSDVGTTYGITPMTTLPVPAAEVTVGPNSTRRVELDVDTAGLAPGTYPITLNLSRDGVDDVIASDAGTITVPDMSQPSNQTAIRDALTEMSENPASSLDPGLYETFVEMAATQIGAPVANFVRPAGQRFLLDDPTAVSWEATDPDGPLSYDLVRRVAPPSSGFGTWSSELSSGSGSGLTLDLVPGTHCLRVRARDALSNVGPYTVATCFGIPIPAAAGSESAHWQDVNAADAYHGTLLSTRTKGASIEFTGLRYRRLILVASRVPDGGRVDVFVGTKREARIDLEGALSRRKVYSIDTRSNVSGGKKVRIVVSSPDGDLVQVEALGVSRT